MLGTAGRASCGRRSAVHLCVVDGAQAVEDLPNQESPELFGLHPNADLTFRTLQVPTHMIPRRVFSKIIYS